MHAVKHRIILSFGVSFVIDIATANDFFFMCFEALSNAYIKEQNSVITHQIIRTPSPIFYATSEITVTNISDIFICRLEIF